nr:hypothetical protein ISGA_3909 [Gordonia sp. NB41Y]
MGADVKDAELIALRHELHRVPEVGMDLPVTQGILVKHLRDAGLEVRCGAAMTSVTAIVRGGAVDRTRLDQVPTVLVRSDMDALPIQEETGLEWAATNGAMHACGHDVHMAVVVAAAMSTYANRDELKGDVIFFFQPGEEGHGGAQRALAEGLLDAAGARPRAALGLHVLSHLLSQGEMASRPGAVLSGSTLVDIVVTGRGGHGSAPHLAASPLTAAAEMVGATTAAAAHAVSMFEPSTVTFGALQAGEARNVIPDRAELSGVIRAFSEATTKTLEGVVRRTVTGIAAAHDVTVEIELRRDTLPTISDPCEFDALLAIADKYGRQVTRLSEPVSISEDFSWILNEVPGVFLLVGARTSDEPNLPSNHSSRATFSDVVLSPTAELVTNWVRERLEGFAASLA